MAFQVGDVSADHGIGHVHHQAGTSEPAMFDHVDEYAHGLQTIH
jgi:hypothetical protein